MLRKVALAKEMTESGGMQGRSIIIRKYQEAIDKQ